MLLCPQCKQRPIYGTLGMCQECYRKRNDTENMSSDISTMSDFYHAVYIAGSSLDSSDERNTTTDTSSYDSDTSSD